MSDVKWTNEQADAIKIRNSNTLVAAGAGSGKTAVLVERIIRKIIDDKVNIDNMLIVTFTNAAASEMKERIRKRLYEEVSTNKDLQKQILYLNRSSIMTIDAFCKKAVKDYFYKLDIDPNFKIADNTELEIMKLETLEELLEELYESTDENIIEVLDAYSGNKSDDDFISLILQIYRFIQSSPKPLEWLNEKCEMYNVKVDDFSNTIWGNNIIHYTRNLIEEIVEELKNTVDSLLGIAEANNYMLTLQDDILRLEALRKKNFTWDDYYNEFKNIEFSALKRAPKLDEETRDFVKQVRQKMKDQVIDYLRDSIYISSSKEILLDLKKAYKHAQVIKDIITLFDTRFKAKKSEKNILDFSDIEHLCLKLFEENPDVLTDYKNKYSEILIDEYQDSNLMQEYILNMISNGNVFMVGDVKQSIYKFRQARPELFLEKYNSYNKFSSTNYPNNSSTNNNDIKTNNNIQINPLKGVIADRPNNKILLFKNFRSNKNVVDEINFIFKNIMYKETGEIEYTEDEYLKYGSSCYDYKGEEAELHIIEKQIDDDDIDMDLTYDIEENPQIEAKVIAKRIEELVGNFEIYDKDLKQKRKATYKDIVILLRATKDYAQTIIDELSERNIPCYSDNKQGYFENMEVQIMLSLLKIIDNPYQDIPLLAILRSPIGNFTVNELTKIRLYNKKCSFYDAMLIASAQGDEKVKSFINKLNNWREKSRYFVIDELISYLYDETGFYYYVSLLPGGEARQNNLKALLKKATEYEKSSYKGLYNFLVFMDNVKENSGDFDAPSELSEADNVVRIMSIHKSKGLEFPIVILAGTTRKFNKLDFRNKIILHQDLGLGFDIIDMSKRLSYESVPKLALKLQSEKEMLAEEMRILYVALTRAKEKLIITALTSNIESKIKSWSSPLTKYSISTANSFADWICKVVLSTKNDWKVIEWKYNDVLRIDKNNVNKSDKNIKDNTTNENKSDKNNTAENNINEANNISNVINYSNLSDDLKVKSNADTNSNGESTINEDNITFINNRFNWVYPYLLSTKIPAKLSVSELKRLHNFEDYTDDIDLYSSEFNKLNNTSSNSEHDLKSFLQIQKIKDVEIPSFIEDKKESGESYGTLLHSLLEKIDFNDFDIDELLSSIDIEDNIKNKLKTDLEIFKNSDLFSEISNSEIVKREVPFNLSVPAKSIFTYDKQSIEDNIMVQGIIDLYYENEKGITIVDYKTDKINNEEEFKHRYSTQLKYYKLALERITNKKVINTYIFSFNLKKKILL